MNPLSNFNEEPFFYITSQSYKLISNSHFKYIASQTKTLIHYSNF